MGTSSGLGFRSLSRLRFKFALSKPGYYMFTVYLKSCMELSYNEKCLWLTMSDIRMLSIPLTTEMILRWQPCLMFPAKEAIKSVSKQLVENQSIVS